ncbi:late embryogenesis abundant protein At1g64065-like [Durio zibethinus]|uniref:Late embryogenesis abundant protein At1g64065-like n=1 Tax=Durio zibethinus TaxID=66656 RepID=A0A6P6B801_DURZI|nr:late embryogenesis abundant protein At1g64065-like [Durio zibethinus]
MAEKDQQMHPLAPANEHPRSDGESASLQLEELKRKKRIKYAVYIAAFVVFQTIVILVFALTVMRVKNPKVRIGRVTIETMETNNTGTAAAAPSFDLKFIAQVTVKNTNFGHYRFDYSTLTFLYDGVIVGEAIIPKARARARSTKRLDVTVEVNSRALPSTTGLASELSSNILTLNSHAKLTGKVELMKLMKKRKSPEMNCTLTFDVSTRNLQDLNCK